VIEDGASAAELAPLLSAKHAAGDLEAQRHGGFERGSEFAFDEMGELGGI
jgi:hypothetical protein